MADREAILDYVRETYRLAGGGFPDRHTVLGNLDAAFPDWRNEPGIEREVEQVIHAHTDSFAVKTGSAQESSTAATSGAPGGVHPPRGSAQADLARRERE